MYHWISSSLWLYLSYLKSIHGVLNHAGCGCRSSPLSQRGVWRACRLTAESSASSTLPRWTRRGGEVVLKRRLSLTTRFLLYLAVDKRVLLVSSRIDRQRLHKVKPSSPVQENSTEAPLMAPSAQVCLPGGLANACSRNTFASNGFHQMMCVCVCV